MQSPYAAFVSVLTPEQREGLLKALTSNTRFAPTDKARELQQPPRVDLAEAEPIQFTADIVDAEHVRNKDFIGKPFYMKGHTNAKGPKGGRYLLGDIWVGKGDARRHGTIKVGVSKFEPLEQGGSMDAWVRFDDDERDTFVGVLENLELHDAAAVR